MRNNRYLLDTTEIITVLRGNPTSTARLQELVKDKAELGICSIIITETLAGTKPQARSQVKEFLASFCFHPLTPTIAAKAGEYLYDYARVGIALSLTDASIAAIAISNKLTLVTRNVKHYPMPEMAIINLDTI